MTGDVTKDRKRRAWLGIIRANFRLGVLQVEQAPVTLSTWLVGSVC